MYLFRIVDLTARHLDTLSNSELASHMGWSDANARGPGVDAEASIAVGILREGLPEAMEKGIVRILDGPEYNIPLSPSDNPNVGPTPTRSIMWHVLSSTSSLKVYDQHLAGWRVGFSRTLLFSLIKRHNCLITLGTLKNA